MPDQPAFEARLADAYTRYLAGAPVSVDARAMAAASAASAATQLQGLRGLTRGVASRRIRLPLALLLGAAALVSAAIIGSSLWPVVTPPEATETPPSASGAPSLEPSGAPAPTPIGDHGGGLITVGSTSPGHVLAPDGASEQTFTGGGMYCPRLSPDGTAVSYLRRFDGFFVTRLADDSRVKIADWDAVGSFGYKEGAWSPDRAHLAFRVDLGTEHALKVLSVPDGALTTLVTTTPGELASEAAWSPDSTLVALARLARSGQLTIDIVDLQGVVQRSIGPLADGLGGSLSWSPGGDRLVYQDGSARLQIVDLATGARRALSSAVGASFTWPEASPWSPDGEWIAVAGADGDLEIISVDGPLSTSMPMPGGITTLISWSPTANVVAFGGEAGLAVVQADGSFSRVDLTAIGESNPWSFAWSPDGSRIVVAEHRGVAGVEVTSLDATGRTAPVRLATYPEAGPDETCVSWDQVVPR